MPGSASSRRSDEMPAVVAHPQPAMPLAALLKSHPESAFDYLEFRLIVAGIAARMAAERATDEDRARLTTAYEAVVAADRKADPAVEADADAEFHLAIYAATHNVVMEHIMRSIFGLLRRDAFYDRSRLYRREGVRELLLRQHKAIYDGIMNRNPEAARIAAEKHIQYTREALQESRVADERLAVAMRRAGRDSLAQVADREP